MLPTKAMRYCFINYLLKAKAAALNQTFFTSKIMNVKATLPILFALISIFDSCCPFIKEEYLGNNLYLSEYDNVDREILYSEVSCSGSGIEIVPMTVLEYDFNSDWIIAKSGNKRANSDFYYWIIKNSYDTDPTLEVIKSNTLGPLGLETFLREMASKKIQLKLKRID